MPDLAIQSSAYTKACGFSSPSANLTASRICATCHDLLRKSPNEAVFQDAAISALSQVRKVLGLTLQQRALFGRTKEIKQVLDQLLESVLDVLKETWAYGQGNTLDRRPEVSCSNRSINMLQCRKDQLFDQFWICQLAPDFFGSYDAVDQISQMRNWLRPNDETVRAASSKIQATRAMYAEFTCEWFSKSLLDFVRSSDKTFWIEGSAGCGKSMLYGWIVDSLQNQVGGHRYAVLSHVIDSRLPTGAEASYMLKELLRQGFEQNPGLITLYNALAKAIDSATKSDYDIETTDALWEALHTLLHNTSQPSILVIDGLSELTGGVTAVKECYHRLFQAVSESRTVKLLVLSRHIDLLPQFASRRLAIDKSHVHEDIRRVLNSSLLPGDVEDRTDMIHRIIRKADGNFLWSLLALQVWKSELGQDFSTRLESLPNSLAATALLLVSKTDFSNQPLQLLLLASSVAVRPLTVAEAKSLLSVHNADKSVPRQDFDIIRMVDQGCGSIMTVDDGMIYFCHPVFIKPVHEMAQSKPGPSLTDINIDISKRLLLYLKLVTNVRIELTIKPVASTILEDLFGLNPLLTYALRYWTWHLLQSGLVPDFHSVTANSGYGSVFPDSIFVAVLETTFWTKQSPREALRALRTSVQMRRKVLGVHPATLQITASLAVYLRDASRFSEAAATFAAAFQLAQQLLPEFDDFTVSCVFECLESLKQAPDAADRDPSIDQPTMLRYMAAKYSKQYGPSSDKALEFGQALAVHYATTGQNALSVQSYRDIHGLTADRFGKSSSQAKAVANDLATLLQQSNQSGDQRHCGDLVLDNAMEIFPANDDRHIQASILKAEAYQSEGDQINAEMIFLSLLHEISSIIQPQKANEDQLKLINVGLLYARYLTGQNRAAEAQGILIGFWTLFDKSRGQGSAATGLLKNIAHELQQTGLYTMSLTVLNFVSEWSSACDADPNDVMEFEENIIVVAQQLIKTSESRAVLSKPTEDALIRTFRSDKFQRTSKLIAMLTQICQVLLNSFVLEERWYDVVNVASTMLRSAWPSVLDNDSEPPSAEDFSPEVEGFAPELRDIALNLASSYSMINKAAEAVHVYQQVLQSIKRTGLGDSQLFVTTAQTAIDAFGNAGQIEQMIFLARNLISHYEETLGGDATLTVDSSYTLASLCMQHGQSDVAKSYFTKIATNLRQPKCHDQRALPALKALLKIFLSDKCWVQAQNIYGSLWHTFLEKGKEYGIHEDTARDLHEGFSQLLNNQLHVDMGVLHRLHEEYKNGCVSAFGLSAHVTIDAILYLAESWEQKESNSLAAIRLYESVIDLESDLSPAIKREVAKELDDTVSVLLNFYRDRINEVMDPHTVARGSRLAKKQYMADKANLSHLSTKFLSSLTLWVALLTKEGSLQSKCTAVQELQQAVDSILMSDCAGNALFDAAITLASSFVDNGYLTEGTDIIQALREQMIYPNANTNQVQISQTSAVGRSKMTFLTAFETRMRGSIQTFAENHSRALLEAVTWESVQTLIQSASPTELVLAHGAKLQTMLSSHYPTYKVRDLSSNCSTSSWHNTVLPLVQALKQRVNSSWRC